MPVPDAGPAPAVGDVLDLHVGPVAHGGHCVARVGDTPHGQVVFVRHTLPGERVSAVVTGSGGGGRFLRADAVEVHEASPDRVPPPCPFAGPGRCGGCDWQHADLAAQRRLKAAVVHEQLTRVGGCTEEELARVTGPEGLVCEPLPGDDAGLRWRTRVEVALAPRRDGDGVAAGLRAHRSHRVVPVDDCLIAAPGVVGTGVFEDPQALVDAARVPTRHGRAAPRVSALDVVSPGAGDPLVVPLVVPGDPPRRRGRRPASRRGSHRTPEPLGPVPEVVEKVRGHEFRLSARGFWQVHPGAASEFTEQVLDWLDPQPGERALDLYAGVGLFAVPLAEAVGDSGEVLAVEADAVAADAAVRHLDPYPWAQAHAGPTEEALAGLVAADGSADVVVLDPPRSGAGAEVVRALAALRPRAVVYVACDPAALARDLATAREEGLELVALRVLDAFPMTHHVECLALLRPAPAPS
ncbi:class I SAM-dependent RNA methyltransferase [uncultured Serinicoccus sp.]|uniref:class I SAM-dependent RNA methyltransferase n=1 Tax=uncultured Serinicoccus sp. TaxID=735514 RepID=UPI0026065936|nr:TRAM domain-containing protein [uncultured Serinicoccus sp.]